MSVAENSTSPRCRARGPSTARWSRGRQGSSRGVRAERPVTALAGALPRSDSCSRWSRRSYRSRRCCLDEPTTALGPEDIEQLHALVFERSRRGVGVVYVSHRLPEVLGIADRITVLRDGVAQGTFDAAGMSENALVTLMIGRPLQLAFPDRDTDRAERDRLEISGLEGDRSVRSISRSTRARSSDRGRRRQWLRVQFLRALAGAEHSTGTTRCNGNELGVRSPLDALRAGAP